MKIELMPPMAGQGEKGAQVKAQGEADSFARLLEQAKKNQDDKALQEACRQFETYFLQQMIKGMRSTVPQSDLLPRSYAREIYEGMLDEKYGEEMAKAGGIGLAKMMYEDLTRKNK